MTDRPVLGGIVIANYITVTTDSETSIHISKGHNLFVKLSQEIHNKVSVLPAEEAVLMIARIL